MFKDVSRTQAGTHVRFLASFPFLSICSPLSPLFVCASLIYSGAHGVQRGSLNAKEPRLFIFLQEQTGTKLSAKKPRVVQRCIVQHETMCLVSRTWPCQLDVKVESTANLFSEKIYSADDHPTDTRLIQHSAGTASNGTPVSCYLKWQIEQATWDSFRSSSTLSKVIE